MPRECGPRAGRDAFSRDLTPAFARPAVLAVTAIRPGIGLPNGFAARYAHFLRALDAEFSLHVAVLDRPTLSPLLAAPDLPAGCRSWDGADGAEAGRLRRLTGRLHRGRTLPTWATTVDSLERRASQSEIALAVGLHFRAADVLVSLPPSVRKIALLEEYDPTLTGRSLLGNARERLEVRREERLFRRVGRSVDRVAAISGEEASRWRSRCPGAEVTVLPHGVDCAHFGPRDAEVDIDVGFFGMFAPGRDAGALHAADALCAHSRTAGRRMAFVGTEPSPQVRARAAQGALVTGRVADMREWYARTAVVVAADEVGPGVKTTVLEAWAMAKPVVATWTALRGLPVHDGVNVLAVETGSDLAGAVATLLGNPGLADRIGWSGRETVTSEHDVRRVGAELIQLCKEVLARTGDRPPRVA